MTNNPKYFINSIPQRLPGTTLYGITLPSDNEDTLTYYPRASSEPEDRENKATRERENEFEEKNQIKTAQIWDERMKKKKYNTVVESLSGTDRYDRRTGIEEIWAVWRQNANLKSKTMDNLFFRR